MLEVPLAWEHAGDVSDGGGHADRVGIDDKGEGTASVERKRREVGRESGPRRIF
jgi:hypothetical protein